MSGRSNTEHVYTNALDIHPCDDSEAVSNPPLSRGQSVHLAGCRLEAIASRFEDVEDNLTKREIRTQSTSTVTSVADAQPASAPSPPAPPAAPPAIVVRRETPPSVQTFDAIVIEARLKPLVGLTAAFGPQVLVDQVRLSHSMAFNTSYVLSLIGRLVCASDSGAARLIAQGCGVQEARSAGL